MSRSASESKIRYYEERPCEHDAWIPHATDPAIWNEDGKINKERMCPGGSRREIIIDYEMWADRVARWLWDEYNESVHIGYLADAMERFLDAAMGSTGE